MVKREDEKKRIRLLILLWATRHRKLFSVWLTSKGILVARMSEANTKLSLYVSLFFALHLVSCANFAFHCQYFVLGISRFISIVLRRMFPCSHLYIQSSNCWPFFHSLSLKLPFFISWGIRFVCFLKIS